MDINDLGALEALPSDVSPRKYFRGIKDGRSFILMLYPDASEEHQKELLKFIRIGNWLSDKGIKTPELYFLDEEKCMAQFEDLGKDSFGNLLLNNKNKQVELYELATDILIKLSKVEVLENLPIYNDSKIHKTHRQIIDYYLPISKVLSSRAKSRDLKVYTLPEVGRDDMGGYLNAWSKIEQSLPPCPQGFVHGDYHLENLIYVDGECALIDYQDALYGSLPYDLVNLLEDARVDIPQAIRNAMINRYCENMSEKDKAIFLQWYRVLGTQFHCRVIGLFIKLAAEQGRDDYLIHINRLQNYISEALKDPLLSPLKSWFENECISFDPINDLNGSMIRDIFTS